MSDFLANIYERTFTTSQAIRPRPLSVFEAFQATGVAGFAQHPRPELEIRLPESDNLEEVSLTPDAMTTREPAVGQRDANTISVQASRLGVSAAIPDPRTLVPTPDEQTARQGKSRSAEVQAPRLGISVAIADLRTLAPTAVDQSSGQGECRPAARLSPAEHAKSIRTKVPADDSISPAFEVRSRLTLESPDGHQTGTSSRLPATEGRIDRKNQESAVPEHHSKIAGTISERTLLKPAIERFEMEKPVPAQLPQQPIAPLQSRLETAWEEKNASMQKEKSTPTIHVTIGRIEVRATTAPIQKQPKPREPDALSLDYYLRRRNGGGR